MRSIALILSLLLVAVSAREVIEYVTIQKGGVGDDKITLHKLSTSESEDIPVSGLDFSHLKGFNLNTFLNENDGYIIFMGYFTPNGDLPNPMFVALQEYVALPNPNPHILSPQADYYTLAVRNPKIECFVAPCNNLLAWNIRTGEVVEFTTLDTEMAVGPSVDQKWLHSHIFANGEGSREFSAVVYGSFHDGKTEPGGVEKVFSASEIYVHIPDRTRVCPSIPDIRCEDGMVPAFKRDWDRCLESAGCVDDDVMCIQSIPECSEGYTLESYMSVTGCLQYFCDPSFL